MVRYLLDPASSRFTVQAFAAGLLSGLAHSPTFAIRQFTGELRFGLETVAQTAIHLTVKADSLTVQGDVSPNDREEIEGRMRREVLETAASPEVVFASTEIAADKVSDNWYRLRVQGSIRLRGVQKPQPVEAQLQLLEDGVRLSGQCTLLLSAFGIKPVTALGGLIKLKDELKFDFDLVGRKHEG
jgi:polyisoprenoid-binding protein YceI